MTSSHHEPYDSVPKRVATIYLYALVASIFAPSLVMVPVLVTGPWPDWLDILYLPMVALLVGGAVWFGAMSCWRVAQRFRWFVAEVWPS